MGKKESVNSNEKEYINVSFREDEKGNFIPYITGMSYECPAERVKDINNIMTNVAALLKAIKEVD